MDNLTTNALKRFWGLAVDSLNCVDEEEGRRCYKAATANTALFVKVQRNQDEFVEDMERGFRLQAYLQKNGFPTNSIRPSKNDNLVEKIAGYGIVVEPWIERQTFEKDLKSWNVFGKLVGQLHSFSVPKELALCISKMDPDRTLDGVLQQIDDRRNAVPEKHSATVRSFRKAANELEKLESVPRTLIHSDLAWGNVIQTVDGEFMLVDFEGGGMGPPVMDLVEVTTYLCRGPSASGSLQEDAAVQFYRGYRKHRELDTSEVTAFGHAHLYHQLYYLANSLGRDDFDFISRMSARLDNWNSGVLDQLLEIATS